MEAGALWRRVEQNVEWVERRAYELAVAETDRTRTLDGKASQVLAVSALATSIAASTLAPRLEGAPAGAAWLAAAAAGAVFLSAGASIWALFPRAFRSFTSEEIGSWPTGDFLTQRSRDVEGRVLNGWLGVIGQARAINSRKANLVRVALVSLGVALVLTAAAAGSMTTMSEKDPKPTGPSNQGGSGEEAPPTGNLFPRPGLGPNTAGQNPPRPRPGGGRRERS